MAADTRPSPHSLEAERAVLGAVLIKPAALEEAAGVLLTDDFLLPAHREIFEAMQAVAKRGRPVEILAVVDELRARGMIDRLDGGEGYMLTLSGSVPTAENAAHYVGIVKEKASLRRLIAICADVQSRAYGSGELGELLDDAGRELAKLATGQDAQLAPVGPMVSRVLDLVEQRQQAAEAGKRVATGVCTGVTKLDELTTGAQPGEVYVVAADTGAGKSALAVQMALRLAEEGGSAAGFQLEMPALQLVERSLAHRAQINGHSIRSGKLSTRDWRKLHEVGKELAPRALYFADRCFRMREIVSEARRWRTKHPDAKGLIVVDYLQLIWADRERGANRAREIGLMAQEFKRLAKELGVPIVLVSQFNREGKKAERAPSRHDLRESGDIEDAADAIVLIHNANQTEDGAVDLILDKNRNGPTRTVRARWIGRWFMFTDPDWSGAPHWSEEQAR